jgi:hypothetical protein
VISDLGVLSRKEGEYLEKEMRSQRVFISYLGPESQGLCESKQSLL